MAETRYDIVDVHVSSKDAVVDAILEHPLLDGRLTYTMELTELVCPLSAETPLPSLTTFSEQSASMYLFNVRRKRNNGDGAGINTDDTRLSGITSTYSGVAGQPDHVRIGTKLLDYETFLPDQYNPVLTINDLAFALQQYFDNIRMVYATSAAGLEGDLHGEDGDDYLPAQMLADDFVKVFLTANGSIKLVFSRLFCTHFFILTSAFSNSLFGFEDDSLIAFRRDNAGVLQTGLFALTNSQNPAAPVIEGDPGETCVLIGKYPVTRNFEHRVAVDVDTTMPVPATVQWLTSGKQAIKHTVASFPISQTYETAITMNTFGGAGQDITFSSPLLQGNIVWRRAESKVSERFQITNSSFFQNILLSLFIERRVWDIESKSYVFRRFPLTLNEDESWSAKIRFKTLKK